METVSSVVTSKFQITIPKAVRENLKLSINDTLTWKIEGNKVVVVTEKNKFLGYKNAIKIGEGEIRQDIERARELKAEKYR